MRSNSNYKLSRIIYTDNGGFSARRCLFEIGSYDCCNVRDDGNELVLLDISQTDKKYEIEGFFKKK